MSSIQAYIESGILELYVMGITSPEETRKVEQMAAAHAEIRQEINAISSTLEAYALAHAVPPKPDAKPLLLATIDYMERLQQGEAPTFPPLLTQASQPADYQLWLNRGDMVPPDDYENLYIKIIGATPEVTTAIVWIKDQANNEVHHDQYERFLILEGSCTVTAGTEEHYLHPGDFYSVPLHTPHTVQVTSAVPCKVIVQRVAA